MWSPRSRACPVMWTCGTSLQWQQHNTQSSSGIDKVKQLLKSLKLAVCPVQKGKHKAQLPSWLIALSLLNSLLGFIVWTWLTKKFWYINNSLRLARKYLVNKPLQAAGMSADNVRGWEIVRKMNIWQRSEASRANVRFWGQSLSQGHYQPTYQQARKGFIYFITLPLIFISQN